MQRAPTTPAKRPAEDGSGDTGLKTPGDKAAKTAKQDESISTRKALASEKRRVQRLKYARTQVLRAQVRINLFLTKPRNAKHAEFLDLQCDDLLDDLRKRAVKKSSAAERERNKEIFLLAKWGLPVQSEHL